MLLGAGTGSEPAHCESPGGVLLSAWEHKGLSQNKQH